MLVVEVGLIINYIIFLSEGKSMCGKKNLFVFPFVILTAESSNTQNRGREGRGLNL